MSALSSTRSISTLGPISTSGLDNPSLKLNPLSSSPQISPLRVPTTTGVVPSIIPTVQPEKTSVIKPTPIAIPSSVPTTSLTPRAKFSQQIYPTVPPVSSVVVSPVAPSGSGIVPIPISTASGPSAVPAGPEVLSVPKVSPTVLPEVPLKTTISTVIDPKSISFKLPGLSDQTVEKSMNDLGFTPLVKTLTKKKDGTVEARYIKSVDSRGNISYVQLNVDSNVSVQPNDLTTVETVSASSTPYSLQNGIMTSVKMDVAGVAFECENGLCTLSRESPDMVPRESVLTYIEKPTDKVVVEGDSPIAYPIVKLSDILENPTLTMISIDKATKSIRAQTYTLYMREIANTEKVVSDTVMSAMALLTSMKNAMDILNRDLNKLEALRSQYDLNPPRSEEDVKKYDLLIHNIKIRQDKLKDLLNKSRQQREYIQALLQLKESFDSMNKQLINEFTGLEGTVIPLV